MPLQLAHQRAVLGEVVEADAALVPVRVVVAHGQDGVRHPAQEEVAPHRVGRQPELAQQRHDSRVGVRHAVAAGGGEAAQALERGGKRARKAEAGERISHQGQRSTFVKGMVRGPPRRPAGPWAVGVELVRVAGGGGAPIAEGTPEVDPRRFGRGDNRIRGPEVQSDRGRKAVLLANLQLVPLGKAAERAHSEFRKDGDGVMARHANRSGASDIVHCIRTKSSGWGDSELGMAFGCDELILRDVVQKHILLKQINRPVPPKTMVL
ncbi:hypothetical protein PAPYR_13380 [Paratrimastix pyriformis]|uniref:Uncharacterized protein n=1 Tax=Paratrimastix pyriformis TaxID=342808 RepID=A0ABQ8U0B6_9EUKA|nr:hypothetical protein PAPYR_13380 [Paratrimastix pyriformis]